MPATTTLPRSVRADAAMGALPARGSRESGHSRLRPLRAACGDELLYLDDVPLQLSLGSRSIARHQVVHDLSVEGDRVPRQGLRRARLLPYGLHDVDDGPDQQWIDWIARRLGQQDVEVEVLLDSLAGLGLFVEAPGALGGGGEAGQLGAARVLHHRVHDEILEGEPDLRDVPELEIAEAQEITERSGDGLGRLPAHEGPAPIAGPYADEPGLLEDPEGLADRPPAHLELAHQLAFRGQAVAGPETAGQDGVPNVLDDLLENPRTAKRAERDRRHWPSPSSSPKV